jgi:hypothetical protein
VRRAGEGGVELLVRSIALYDGLAIINNARSYIICGQWWLFAIVGQDRNFAQVFGDEVAIATEQCLLVHSH